MATTNNFKQMAKEDQELIPHAPERVEKQVMGVVKTGQFAGNIIELYFSKMLKMVMMLVGSNPNEMNSDNTPNSNGEVR